VFALAIPFAIVSFALAIKAVPDKIPEKSSRLDVLSFLILSIMMTTSVIALNELSNGGEQLRTIILFVVAAVTLAMFIYRSLHSTKQFLNVRVLKNPAVWATCLFYMIYQLTNLGTNVMLPNYLQIVAGSSTIIAGLSMMPGSLLGCFFNPSYGKMYDRKGPKIPLYTSSISLAVVLVLWIIFSEHLTALTVIILYILFTLTRNMGVSNSMATGLSTLEGTARADANAFYNTCNQFAGAVGTTIATLFIRTDASKSISVARQTAIGTRHLFIFFFILILICIGLLVLTFHSMKKHGEMPVHN
jgi:nitrate/nitrite transporter NarK